MYMVWIGFQWLHIKINKEFVSYVSVFPSGTSLKLAFAKMNQLLSTLDAILRPIAFFLILVGHLKAWQLNA